jgi:dipeptidase E
MKVLALSSSRTGNGGFLQEAAPMIREFGGKDALQIAFIPFASVQRDGEEYTAMVREALAAFPLTIHEVTPEEGHSVLQNADMIMIGGGNTFKLLHHIYHYHFFELVQDKVRGGTPYVGWSAGTNICGRSISTTNDMPIIQPASFVSFGFFPFQINPHYINLPVEGHNGETRDQRLEEFVLLNPGIPVLGLPEGAALQLQDGTLRFIGPDGVLFQSALKGRPQKTVIAAGADLSNLL